MDLKKILYDIYEDIKPCIGQGLVADYIPELAKVDPDHFGMSIALPDGNVYSVGDFDVFFSVQSISKVFLLTMVLQNFGDDVWKRIGREPTGWSFDSIIQLEYEHGVPRNPFVNAGSIVMADMMLEGISTDCAIENFLIFMRKISDDQSIYIDSIVADSEISTGYRNYALANSIHSYRNLNHNIEDVLKVYFNHCAIVMNCAQLARSGLYLSCRGFDPLINQHIISPQHCKFINSLMLTCGHYDNSGDFACRVGLPGKSGVGGGILAVVPSKASIAVWSPGLNKAGNSLLGANALELLSSKTGWSIFDFQQ
ncbi:glutaminase [Candidatus Liberibacter americanus]|uniref:Glutaminase n=1 Tax=Candidatus Liberibacter americanus str. Sao Paulo TaxID=1261131 RepID=U6B513_9HYPH|nr:glutaminase [Candidatus Liberibacter americanus]AHA28164.1 Glutaminase [Candidatus Liberibacter americanus str. Sao Paulo]EMS35924.1 glutaminase [Candidatus Liberibacter americanus PW_SP]